MDIMIKKTRPEYRLIERFRHYGQWYADIRAYIVQNYADPDLFADLLSATSPRQTVKENWKLANRIYREHKVGLPYSRIGLLPCHTANIDRAILGQELSGNKVRSFSKNLRGDFEHVTVDVWILRFFGYSGDSAPSGSQYADIVKRIKCIAKRYQTTPAAMQAILWTIARHNAGFGPSSFLGETRQQTFDFAKE